MRGNGRYSVGTFDGSRFQAETEPRDSDLGPNFYATQTWNNTEAAAEAGQGVRPQGRQNPTLAHKKNLTPNW